MTTQPFQVICEVEPPTRPNLMHVRHQIGTLSKVAHSFLVPDNHMGRATVSSVAVAHEVQAMGGTSIACLNCRDRNVLGFRRDMLTAAAYGVDRFLFVYGDKPDQGSRTGQLTVRTMIDEVRSLGTDRAFRDVKPFQAGVAVGYGPLPGWKRAADFFFLQAGFSVAEQLRWRESQSIAGPVYAGVMVIASKGHADRLRVSLPAIKVPDELAERLASDPLAGVDNACQQIMRIKESGAFDGVHLIPVAKYRDVAARLEQLLRADARTGGQPRQS